MGKNYKQYLSVSKIAKLLGMGSSTLSKKLYGITIEGIIRDNKNIKIDTSAIPEIKKMLDYNDLFDKGNYLSTRQVAEYLKSVGIDAKRNDINNWIRDRKVPSILHMGFRYIEQSNCDQLGQLIMEERTIPSGFCSVEDAAKLIDVHPVTIMNWASDGEIESKLVIVDQYKRLYVAIDKLSDVKLKKALNGLKNLQNADIEKLREQNAASIINRKKGAASNFSGKNNEKLVSTHKWLTTFEAGQMLNIKHKSTQAFLRRGKFPNAVKEKNIWFIPESDVLNYQNRKISGRTFPHRLKATSEKRDFAPPDEFMTVKQVALHLKLSTSSVWKMINGGLFPAARKENNFYWIIPKSDYQLYLEGISNLKVVSEKREFVPPEGFMKVEKVTVLLKLSTAAVFKMIRRGLFPSARKENNRYWIIPNSDIEQYLKLKTKSKSIVKFGKQEVTRELLNYLASVKVPHAII